MLSIQLYVSICKLTHLRKHIKKPCGWDSLAQHLTVSQCIFLLVWVLSSSFSISVYFWIIHLKLWVYLYSCSFACLVDIAADFLNYWFLYSAFFLWQYATICIPNRDLWLVLILTTSCPHDSCGLVLGPYPKIISCSLCLTGTEACLGSCQVGI